MLVSVIIPTFNRAHLVSRAITSVIQQSYKNLEIIVVDDGSTDNTEAVVAKFVQQTSNIIYIQKSNGGCASARNKGLELARGDYLTFLDSDDEWVLTAIETLVDKIQESGADLAYSPSIEVDLDGIEKIDFPVAAGQPELLAKKHFMNTKVRNGSYMFIRAALERVGGLDESLRYNEDSDFFQRLLLRCRAAYSSTPTVRHYDHPYSKSHNRTEIYRALLRSSQKILVENPAFATELGTDVDIRIRQIKGQLVESLLLAGNFSEAIPLAREAANSIRLNVRFALLCKSNVSLKLESSIREYFRALKKPIRKVYYHYQMQKLSDKTWLALKDKEIVK